MKTAERLVPELRFPGFEGEWENRRLNEISVVNPKSESLPNKFIYIDLESVTHGILNQEKVVFKNDAPSRAQRVIAKCDILYQLVRPYQKNNLFFNKDGDYVASTGYAQLRAHGNPYFLYTFLHTTPFVNRIMRWSTGTSYPAISSSDLIKIRIPIPSLPEQQKIASFLSAVDKKIEYLTRKKELLQTYKKGLMQKIFSCRIRFKDDDGKDFPDWEEKRLGEVLINYRLGGNYSNSETKTENPLIKMGNLNRGKINKNKIEYISQDEIINPIDEIKFNDLFFNTRNTLELVGKVAIWKNELPKAYYNSNLMFMKFDNNPFMNYRFNSYEGKKLLRRLATGTTSVAAIYTKDLLKLQFNLPSLPEQQKIASFLSAIDKKIEAVDKQLTQMQTFKKGLLQKMFV